MSDALRVRRYEDGDADAVWTLHERTLAAAGTDPADVPGTDDLRRVRAAYLGPGGEFLVGVLPGPVEGGHAGAPRTDDGALVAMGGFRPRESGGDGRPDGGAAELRRMRVAPDHQRRGHGSRLLGALEDRAREAGFDRLLATTARRQRSAVRFYPARGYAETGRSTHGAYELLHFEKRL